MSQPPTQGELEAESAVTASLSGWGGREVTDLGVELDLAAEGRVAGLLHVAHQARALRLEAPRVLVHILRRTVRSVLSAFNATFNALLDGCSIMYCAGASRHKRRVSWSTSCVGQRAAHSTAREDTAGSMPPR